MSTVMRLEDITLEYPVPRQYRKEDVQPSGVRNISLEIREGEVLGIIGRMDLERARC
jgi:ABC-type glutathione transport system ATPase component